MKKFIFILLAVFLNCNFIYAAEFGWSKVVTNISKDTTFYFDKKTIFKVGNYKYYWMLSDYIIPFEDVKSTITHNVVNCRTFNNKTIIYTSYTGHMGKGKVDLDFILAEDTPDHPMAKWKFLSEDTSHGLVLRKVCR